MNSLYIKPLLLLTICFLSALNCPAQDIDHSTLVGKWELIEDGEKGYLIFDSNGSVSIIAEDIEMKGDSIIMNDDVIKMTYTVNNQLNPHLLIITFVDLSNTEEPHKMYGIYEFIGNDKIKLYLNTADETIPTEFDPLDTVIFKRVSK